MGRHLPGVRQGAGQRKEGGAAGRAGRVEWNFEKFLVLPDGRIERFRPKVLPDDPRIVALIEANLPR